MELGGHDRRPAALAIWAAPIVEEVDDDEDDVGDAPGAFGEPDELAVAPSTCPAVSSAGLSPVRRRLVEMAYGDDFVFYGIGSYLAAAHAAWCWWCCRPSRREAEG